MKAEERWMELCEQASKEQDPERLLELVQEINAVLDSHSIKGGTSDVGQECHAGGTDAEDAVNPD